MCSLPTENLPDQYNSGFYDLQTQILPPYHDLHGEFYSFITFYILRSWTNLPQNPFIVLFDTVHPKDGLRRRPKPVGVVNKQS